ncbi:MAG TPA: hypothetical protein VNQ97_13765 [Burkholderiaceae bacterium]|nr:hypothetical protein [Burkholderiaceae bacterium]
MSHFSDKYVGLPYVAETGDCAALAERVAREVFGKVVGLPTSHATTYREQAKQILELQDSYATKIDAPKDGCPALFIGRGRLCHIGVMCWIAGEWYVLHADSSAGFVVRQRLRDMTRLHWKLEGVYEWK